MAKLTSFFWGCLGSDRCQFSIVVGGDLAGLKGETIDIYILVNVEVSKALLQVGVGIALEPVYENLGGTIPGELTH